ncbi:hypothetical protein [Nannocystis pusilla]|uniref:hypothetical protein n=1 Tax=Nannocystis pusilla TaxID=889268 RepID=UPI003B76A394
MLRRWILPLALMSAPWAIYVAVLSQQDVDALASWRNDIFWPADHYLTVGLAGLVGPFLFYLGFGLGSGVLLAMALMLLAAGVRRVLAFADFSAWPGPVAMIVMPALLFAFKVVPLVVTEVDSDARRLVVREFHWLLRYPTGTREIAATEIEALDVATHFHRGSGYDLIIHALTRHGAVRLGQRLCGAPRSRRACARARRRWSSWRACSGRRAARRRRAGATVTACSSSSRVADAIPTRPLPFLVASAPFATS